MDKPKWHAPEYLLSRYENTTVLLKRTKQLRITNAVEMSMIIGQIQMTIYVMDATSDYKKCDELVKHHGPNRVILGYGGQGQKMVNVNVV